MFHQFKMSAYGQSAWVSETGEYYTGDDKSIILLSPTSLTTQQWMNLSDMDDSDRYAYALAVVSGNSRAIRALESSNGIEPVGPLCRYCTENPIAEGYQHSCDKCVYVCAGCKQTTPYESGGDDEFCDDCWMANQTAP